jgi:hypothetical protein
MNFDMQMEKRKKREKKKNEEKPYKISKRVLKEISDQKNSELYWSQCVNSK